MITYKNVVIPQHSEKRFSHVTCDICKRISTSNNWDAGSYQVCDVKIELREGCSYPDHTHVKKTEYDICPDCFKDKVMPFLALLWAHPTVTEID